MPTAGRAGGPRNAALIPLRYPEGMEWGTVTSTIEDLRRPGFTALLSMVRRGHLDVPIIGVAKGGGSVDRLRARVRQGLEELGGGLDATAFSRLSGLLRYVDGDYQDDDTWKALRAALGPALRPLHYLAIPPSLFPTVIEGLGRLGVGEWGRLIVAKPFGRDLASARSLNRTIHQVFDEDSVFRIDHYLSTVTVQHLRNYGSA